jgi:hypothetical protein
VVHEIPSIERNLNIFKPIFSFCSGGLKPNI